jgi:hypothetical protein
VTLGNIKLPFYGKKVTLLALTVRMNGKTKFDKNLPKKKPYLDH